jgi:hypothetical protein
LFLCTAVSEVAQQSFNNYNFIAILVNKLIPMGLLNQQNKGGNKKSSNKNPKNTGSKFINKGSKPAGGVVNKKGLTGGSRGS